MCKRTISVHALATLAVLAVLGSPAKREPSIIISAFDHEHRTHVPFR